MKEILDKMHAEPMSFEQLENVTHRYGWALRRALKDMESLGLVEKVDLQYSVKKRVGWRKTHHIGAK
jgi:DNA-binding HxlR family transcriptional regulator